MDRMRERLLNPVRIIVDAIGTTATFALKGTRLAIFSVLALVEPIVVWILTAVALILCGLAAFYGLLQWLHPTHFPFGVVFVVLMGCGLVAAGYYALMYLLEPHSPGSSNTPG